MRLLDLRRLGPGRLDVVPQFLQGIELAGGVGEVAALFGRSHGGDEGRRIGDAVLQLEQDSEGGRRGLLAAEGEGALAVKIFADGLAVDGDGFGFGEHSHIR